VVHRKMLCVIVLGACAGASRGQQLQAPDELASQAASAANAASAQNYDWGMVRGYFSGGVVLSRDGNSFSRQDLFLAFNLDKTWRYHPEGTMRKLMVSTFLGTRLTSVPVGDEQSLAVRSRQAALVEFGAYLPFITTEWRVRGKDRNALFIAPLAKVGVQTGGGAPGMDADGRLSGLGLRMGHFGSCGTEGVAPETISYLDILWGRHAGAGNSHRWEMEGRLRVPDTPLMIGFDARIGNGQDDVRFVFGTRFDLAKAISRLRGVVGN